MLFFAGVVIVAALCTMISLRNRFCCSEFCGHGNASRRQMVAIQSEDGEPSKLLADTKPSVVLNKGQRDSDQSHRSS